jgi:methionyl-tRNA synthetase
MDLEEKTIDQIGERCEVCGAKLTPQELQTAMETGGPALCSIHADEVVPLDEDEADFGAE